jgi:hypothetical protein
MMNTAKTLSSHHTLLDWQKPVSSGLRAIFHPNGYLRPKGCFPTLCKRGGSWNWEKDKRIWKKPGITTYAPGMGDGLNAWTMLASACNLFCTNFSLIISFWANDNVLMNIVTKRVL